MEGAAGGGLFAESDRFDRGWLARGRLHRIHFEQSGSRQGLPLLMIHGGPGSGSSPLQRRLVDPGRFRIVQFDQRGCGSSRPLGETVENGTAELIGDIEALREHLGVRRWIVVGGSWGAALAVAYAAQHRQRVSALLLRSIFLTGRRDLDWFFGGAGGRLPIPWARLRSLAPAGADALAGWLWQVFATGEPALQRRVAAAWLAWEQALAGQRDAPPDALALDAAVSRYRIQSHYLRRCCDLGEQAVLDALASVGSLPVLLLHGRRDRVCRPSNALRAWRRTAGGRLAWDDDAGHDPFAPGMVGLMRRAGERLIERGDFSGIGVRRARRR